MTLHSLYGILIISSCRENPSTPLAVLQTETGYIDPVITEKYNTPGFVGCLSRVQFNSLAPLKAALRSRGSVPVSHQGKLVESNCGASPLTIPPMSAATEPWHLDAGTYHTNEAKGGESSESADAAIIGTEANFTETIDESKKEWFI